MTVMSSEHRRVIRALSNSLPRMSTFLVQYSRLDGFEAIQSILRDDSTDTRIEKRDWGPTMEVVSRATRARPSGFKIPMGCLREPKRNRFYHKRPECCDATNHILVFYAIDTRCLGNSSACIRVLVQPYVSSQIA